MSVSTDMLDRESVFNDNGSEAFADSSTSNLINESLDVCKIYFTSEFNEFRYAHINIVFKHLIPTTTYTLSSISLFYNGRPICWAGLRQLRFF